MKWVQRACTAIVCAQIILVGTDIARAYIANRIPDEW